MARIGHLWGSALDWKEWLHPRGPGGRFRSKGGGDAEPGFVKKLQRLLESFDSRDFQSDNQVSAYLHAIGTPRMDTKRLVMDFQETNANLRAGQMDTSTKKFVDMMERDLEPAPHDLLVNRTVGPEAFGLTPQTAGAADGGLMDFQGALVADKGYTVTTMGSMVGQGPIKMSIAVPKGTRIAPSRRSATDRGVMLDRDQPLRITKVTPDGQGGFQVMAVAVSRDEEDRVPGEIPAPLGGHERSTLTPQEREANATGRATGGPARAADREEQRLAELDRQQGRVQPGQAVNDNLEGPTDTGPGGPPPRTEPPVAESIGGPSQPGNAPEAPSATPVTPAAPPVAEEPVRTTDFRQGFRESGLGYPSAGPRRKEFNDAYLGVASGKGAPDEKLRALESDIEVNKRRLERQNDPNIPEESLDPELENDIQAQEGLADFIRKHFNLGEKTPEVAPEPEKPKGGPKPTPGAPAVSQAKQGKVLEFKPKEGEKPAATPRKRGEKAEVVDLEARRAAKATGAKPEEKVPEAPPPVKRTPAPREPKKSDGTAYSDTEKQAVVNRVRQLRRDNPGFPRNEEEERLDRLDKAFRGEAPGPAPIKATPAKTAPVKKAVKAVPAGPKDESQMTKAELLALPEAEGARPSWTKDRIKQHIEGKRSGTTPEPVKKAAPARKTAPTKKTSEELRQEAEEDRKLLANPDLQGDEREAVVNRIAEKKRLANQQDLERVTGVPAKAVPAKAVSERGQRIRDLRQRALDDLKGQGFDNPKPEMVEEHMRSLKEQDDRDLTRKGSGGPIVAKAAPATKKAAPVKAAPGPKTEDQMTKAELLALPDAEGAKASWTKEKIRAHIDGKRNPPPVPEAAPAKEPEVAVPSAPTPEVPGKPSGAPSRVGRVRENGRIAQGKLLPGDEILMEQRADGTWHPTTRVTGAKKVTVDRVENVGKRGRRVSALVVVGRDENGNEVRGPGLSGVQTYKMVPERGSKAPAAQKAIKVPDRKKSFDEAWTDSKVETSDRSAGRSLKEIRDNISSGKFTPDEGIRRLENDITDNKAELAEMDADIRAAGADAPPELRQRHSDLMADIKEQEKASRFLRDHFEEAPAVTPDEVKEAAPELKNFGDQLKAMKPDEVADLKKQVKAQIGLDVEGNTGEEVFDDAIRKIAEREVAERAAKKAVKAAPVKPAPAPEKRLPDQKESPYERLDVRRIAEGIQLSEDDNAMLDQIQDMLDGKDKDHQTPASIGKYLDTWRTGPAGPGTQAAIARGVGVDLKPGETDAEFKQRRSVADAAAARFDAQHASWKQLADRLMKTRRQRKRERAPETEPTVTPDEKKDLAKAAEVTGIPAEDLEKATLARKRAAAPPKRDAQDTAAVLKTVGSEDEARTLLQGRTKADLLEVAKASGVDVKSSATKKVIEDAIVARSVKPAAVPASGGGHTESELMDMSPSELKDIEDELGLERPSLFKPDRVKAILAKQGGGGEIERFRAQQAIGRPEHGEDRR